MADKETQIESDIFDSGMGDDGLPRDDLVTGKSDTSEFEVEILDDTPEVDRNVTAIKDPEPSDDELSGYNEKVQERINKLKHAYHDERRRAESAEREKQAAIDYAMGVQGQLRQSQQAASNTTGAFRTLQSKLDEARAKYDAAKSKLARAGDLNLGWDEVAELQEQMTDARIETTHFSRSIDALEKMSVQPQQPVVQSEHPAQQPGASRQQSVPEPDQRTRDWMSRNKWFGGKDGAESEMTAIAFSTHERLVQQGIDPRTDPDRYYGAIDKRLREVFPSHAWPEKDRQRDAAKGSRVAAPARSAPGTPRKVTLTRSQADVARRLNVPLEEYARQLQLINGK